MSMIKNMTGSPKIPYTYLLGWTKVNLWYYGVRYSKTCHPNDLWNSYKTSSKYVRIVIELFGEPNIIQIRKTFDSVDKAREWEHKVLKRMKVIKNKNWLNKTDNISFDPILSANNKGKKYSSELRQKCQNYKKKQVDMGLKIILMKQK